MMTAEAGTVPNPRLLLVEDEMAIALDMETSLSESGFKVSGVAQTAKQALDMTEDLHPDLVVMDVELPGGTDGISAAAVIRDRWKIPVVFLTANSGNDVVARAKAVGPYGFLTKPFRKNELNATIRVALHHHHLTQALFAEHTWLSTMLESLSDCVIATDSEGFVRFMNPAAEALIGWTEQEAAGRPIEALYSLALPDGTPVGRCQLRKVLESKAPARKQRFCLMVRGGGTIFVEDAATPIIENDRVVGAVTTFRDITQQEKAEHALRESEKLAVVGRMASSISHEINNPLEAITNLLYIAEVEAAPGSPVLEYIRQASAELARITHITTETLRFHRQTTKKTDVPLTKILDSVMVLHEGRVRNLRVSVDKRYSECCPLVVSANEIRQVLANLVGNALDAMVGSPVKRLSLGVRNATCWRTGRRGVRLTIADTGAGISDAASKSLFKPFFTTKDTTGTGLGLWVSAGLVEKHNGWIRFRSVQGEHRHGTVFCVFLPAPAGEA